MVDLPDIQTTEEGREYEKNIMMVLSGEKKDYPSYFGGFMIASGVEFDVISPIDETIKFGIFQEPEDGIMLEAVTSAVKAQKEWAKVPSAERAAYFEMPLRTIEARRLFYAAAVTVATGMAREDALLEVDRLIEIMRKAIADGKAGIKGDPTGVWAVISAHNSPLAAPAGYAVAAMVAGNSVIMNPSRYCPSPLYMFYSLAEKAGLPGGVLNLIVDTRDKTTDDLANDMRVAGVVAAGSGERLEDLMFLQVDDELGFINEIKGMNPAIVYHPADMKAAARAVAESAFAYSGQRPFSCSKVIVTADEQRKFLDALTAEVGKIVISDPVNDTTFSGPIISRKSEERYRALLAENAGFIVAKADPSEDSPMGPYVPFAVLAGLDDENDLSFMDSGFPILNVKVVDSLDDAFFELENTECGLSAGIFSKDQKAIGRFEEEADAPLRFVNKSSRSLAPGIWAVAERFTKRSA
ncbi:MAG: aldehyde dehydrogenase family protein [Candidatus Methanomethylophilaceae archaeon]|nr:aldehyde dehydrogenase family protein [Candidatus Methanomethylophilaceae archaeon]